MRTLILRCLCFLSLISYALVGAASVGDCLKSALSAANPADVAKAAKFASQHPSCIPNFVPPELVPFAALSAAVDGANQSGALAQLGLAFGSNNYGQCVSNLDPGKHSAKALAPVLKPVCSTLKLECGMFEGGAANEVNTQLAQKYPLLSMMPCACAAATSGLGVEKLVELVKVTQSCGALLADAAALLNDASKGVYKTGEVLVNTTEQGAVIVGDLVDDFVGALKSVGCTVAKVFGGCKSSKPTAYGAANKFCAARGGLKQFSSVSNDANEFTLQCNDLTRCSAKPGKPVACMDGNAVKASEQKTAQQYAVQRATNENYCKGRTETLHSLYEGKCHDAQCKLATGFVLSEWRQKCIKENNENVPSGWTYDNYPPGNAVNWLTGKEPLFKPQLETYVVESIMRDPNASEFDKMAAQNCQPFLGRAGEYLCPNQAGFEVCVSLAKAKQVKMCRASNGAVFVPSQIMPALPSATVGGAASQTGAINKQTSTPKMAPSPMPHTPQGKGTMGNPVVKPSNNPPVPTGASLVSPRFAPVAR